jgi:hypothetical protein
MVSERETRWQIMEARAAQIHLEQVVPHYPPTREQVEEQRQSLLQKLLKRKKKLQEGETNLDDLVDDFAKHDKRRSSAKASPIEQVWDAEYAREHPARTGWGPWKNQTREGFAESPGVIRAGEGYVNQQFTDAEIQSSQPQQLSFFQKIGLTKKPTTQK